MVGIPAMYLAEANMRDSEAGEIFAIRIGGWGRGRAGHFDYVGGAVDRRTVSRHRVCPWCGFVGIHEA
jgi:hypothetical protein